MLTIRPAQMAAFARHLWDEFARQATGQLLGEYEAHPALADDIALALSRARSLGLQDGEGILWFARCWLDFGPAFTQHPTVSRLLAHPGHLTPDERLQRLIDGLPDHVWAELELLNAQHA